MPRIIIMAFIWKLYWKKKENNLATAMLRIGETETRRSAYGVYP